MQHVLVMTAPRSRGVADMEVMLVASKLELTPHRLGRHGVEFSCDTRLPEVPVIEGVDFNQVPAANRRKRLLIADMDSTMIPVECIDQMADFAGVGAQVAEITRRAMRGELDFIASMTERVALVAGLAESALQEVYDQRIALNPGGRALVRTMAAHGAQTALVSGGFTFFTERVAAAAGFAEHRANTLEIAEGRLTGKVLPPVLGRDAKVEALDQLCERHGITRDDTVTVGDGANDIGMLRAAGLGVGHHPKPAVAQIADAVMEHSDLDALLFLQGYSEAEFVTD
ncbi:MAG: phosphoserine phosphatase SerB [Pseudomonadota bacterium]